MCKFKNLGVSWPPKGWDVFNQIDQSFGQSLTKDPMSAKVSGLTYVIEPVPLYTETLERRYIYSVRIEGWDYNIHNESREYSILSFILKDRSDTTLPKSYFISDIKTLHRPIRLCERSAHRALMAALFLMKQINSDSVPDVKRILRLYKIHPSQRSLYDIDNVRTDSLFCGLPYARLEGDETETA